MNSELYSWAVPECPFSIVFPADVMNQLRMEAMRSLFVIRRGGIEIGGVLFGSFEEDRVIVQAFRFIECEHAAGPSFILSDSDQNRLEDLLAKSTEDLALAGLVPAGWFRSRTRSEILLSEADVALFDKYFPYLRQVILVLRPETSGVTRAGFFFREDDGGLRTESSHGEFVVELDTAESKREGAVPKGRAAESESAATPPPQPEAELAPALVRADPYPELDFLTTLSKPRSYAHLAWIVVLLSGLTAASLAVRGYLSDRSAPHPQMAPVDQNQSR